MLLLSIVCVPFGRALDVTTLFKEFNLESLLKLVETVSFIELTNKIKEIFFTEVLQFFEIIGVENVAESRCLHFACKMVELLYE